MFQKFDRNYRRDKVEIETGCRHMNYVHLASIV